MCRSYSSHTKPVSRPCGASPLFKVHTAYLGQYTELTFQGDPKSKYELVLFVGNQDIELQKKDVRTWAPVERPYAFRIIIAYTY